MQTITSADHNKILSFTVDVQMITLQYSADHNKILSFTVDRLQVQIITKIILLVNYYNNMQVITLQYRAEYNKLLN